MELLPAFSPDSFLARKVAMAKDVLNFGCGNRKYGDELGIDLSSATDAEYVIQPEQALPFDDGSFDLIVSRFVFEHLADLTFTTAECSRILRPGGELLFVVPHCFSQDAFDDPTHCNYFTLKTGNYLCGKANVHYAKPQFGRTETYLKLSLQLPRWRFIRWPINVALSSLSAFFPNCAEQLVKLPFLAGTLVFVCTKSEGGGQS